jgi:NADH-quinone oxidoreductase subunit B
VGLITEKTPLAQLQPVKFLLNWGRKYSLWVFNLGLACCSIEFIAASTSKHDFIRFGVIPFARGPRQADLLVVAGTPTDKMAPVIKRLYDQRRRSRRSCSPRRAPWWRSRRRKHRAPAAGTATCTS